jgi:hypothetical protein
LFNQISLHNIKSLWKQKWRIPLMSLWIRRSRCLESSLPTLSSS